jgi:hypothetical protein
MKRALDKINVFKPPKEAEEAGFADFRPVSGWKREHSVHVRVGSGLYAASFVQDGARTKDCLDQRGHLSHPSP